MPKNLFLELESKVKSDTAILTVKLDTKLSEPYLSVKRGKISSNLLYYVSKEG